MKVISRSGLFLFGLIVAPYLYAITIHNETESTLFIAPYYVKDKATRAGELVTVNPQETVFLERPDRKLLYDRDIVFVEDRNVLQNEISRSLYKKLPSKNIGTVKGDTFYIARKDGELVGYNTAEWKVIHPVIEASAKKYEQSKALLQEAQKKLLMLRMLAKEKVLNQLPAVRDNPYKEDVAYVRVGNQLCAQEREYLAKRIPKIKTSLEKIVGKKITDDQVATVVVVCSGGGYRAMLNTLGSFCGMKELLDTVTYICTLSGSTWMVGPWISTGWPLEQFRSYLVNALADNAGLASVGPQRAQWMAEAILTRFVFGQPVSLVDFYGALIANALLKYAGSERQQIYLSEQAKQLQNAQVPLPIYTAVRADKYVEEDWYEFTPFEIGGSWLQMYIPSWAYGRSFDKGRSLDFAPEVSLGFNLGTYGSAFALTFSRLYQEMADSVPSAIPKVIIQQLLKIIGQQRISSAQVFNFTYGIPHSVIKDQKVLNMADAGLAFNLPYPPISGQRPERKADVIIFIDGSATLIGAPELRRTEAYARDHMLKFPLINYDGIDTRAISVFKDEHDPTVPVVIYMPFVKDYELWQQYKKSAPANNRYVKLLDNFDPLLCIADEFCSTFNFFYDREQSEKIISQAEFNMEQSKHIILNEIKWAVEHKNLDQLPE